MKIEFLVNEKNPYHVLGVPSFATSRLIRMAYMRRVKMLRPYRFDKATHPIQWQIANDLLQELNEAYEQLLSLDKNKKGHSEATSTAQAKDALTGLIATRGFTKSQNLPADSHLPRRYRQLGSSGRADGLA